MPNRFDPQQHAELEFWRGLIQEVGPEYYHAYRAAEYFEKTRYFPSWHTQGGHGVDVGCGCISVFELSSKQIVCVDPLMEHYFDLLDELGALGALIEPCNTALGALIKKHEPIEEGALSDDFTNYYAFAACLNVIDHTPDPARLLANIHRCLVRGGRLYFEVNFDSLLSAPHYILWTNKTVAKFLGPDSGFQLEHEYYQNVPEHTQTRYWAEYIRV